jgi:aspartyl-tRNA(Asn)/glutamyl-tRNA(Gln) amidotransferase subunit C
MALTQAEVAHVARLARMQLSTEELEHMQAQLSAILDYIALLQEVDVEGVEPTAQVTGLTTLMRPDEPQPALPREKVLANAPDQRDGMFRVRAILEE